LRGTAGEAILFKRGMLDEDKIRQVEVTATVDTGATTIVLPKGVAEELG